MGIIKVIQLELFNIFVVFWDKSVHNLSNPNLEDKFYTTKIIIPQRLKKEIFERINIKASDLGL